MRRVVPSFLPAGVNNVVNVSNAALRPAHGWERGENVHNVDNTGRSVMCH